MQPSQFPVVAIVFPASVMFGSSDPMILPALLTSFSWAIRQYRDPGRARLRAAARQRGR
jgi:hypothetical protein